MSMTGVEGEAGDTSNKDKSLFLRRWTSFMYEVEMGTSIGSYWTRDLAMAKQSCQSAAEWLMPTVQQLSVRHNT